jgi:hypothetical protein
MFERFSFSRKGAVHMVGFALRLQQQQQQQPCVLLPTGTVVLNKARAAISLVCLFDNPSLMSS